MSGPYFITVLMYFLVFCTSFRSRESWMFYFNCEITVVWLIYEGVLFAVPLPYSDMD